MMVRTVEEMREYNRKWHRMHPLSAEQKKFYAQKQKERNDRETRYTHDGYTHDCGKNFDSAILAWIHLLEQPKCESVITNYPIVRE